jgi:hypothetical protein
LPLDGSEIDDCGTSFPYMPVLMAFDPAGNLLLTGRASSNRMIDVSRNALQLSVGDAFFVQVSPAGALLHATWLDLRAGPRGLAVDPAGEVHVAGGSFLQTLSPGRTPVELTVSKTPGCAGQPNALEIRVAAAPDGGSVKVTVDGASLGTLPVRGRLAARPLDLAAGVHRLDAVYQGPGPSDGYASPPMLLPVNQAGACP